MPTDQTKRKERWGRWLEALIAKDLRRAEAVADEMCDQQYVLHNPGLPDFGRGPAAAKAFARSVIATYMNIHLTLEDFFGEGDKTAVRSTVRVTVRATGQRVTYPVLNIMRWEGDMLAERWELAGPHEEQA
jgi:ketosteroid isomerase-like protein